MLQFFKKILSKESIQESYLILFFILLLCILLSSSCISGYFISPTICNLWLKDFSINLVTEVIGILVVVFSINKTVQQNKDKEKNKFKEIAFRQLRFVLRKQVYLFSDMLKASIRAKPDKVYESLKDLFDNTYFEELAFLDLLKLAPVLTPKGDEMDWLDYLFTECKSLKSALGKVVDRYSFYLESEIVDLMEEVSDAGFIRFISSIWEAKKLNALGDRGDLLSACENLLREYTSSLLQLVELYNQSVNSDRAIHIDRSQWDEWWNHNGRPKIGDSRIQIESK